MVPSSSRTRINRVPLGKAARAIRAVSSGTGAMAVGRSDINRLPCWFLPETPHTAGPRRRTHSPTVSLVGLKDRSSEPTCLQEDRAGPAGGGAFRSLYRFRCWLKLPPLAGGFGSEPETDPYRFPQFPGVFPTDGADRFDVESGT